MNVRHIVIGAALTGLMVVAAGRTAYGQELAAARELYAAANYDEALSKLNELASKKDAVTEPGAVALYRALCLYGLGRTNDGDRAVEELVTQNPLYRPPLDDLSPRIRATVTDTRRRLLPTLLQQQFNDAKIAYDRQDFAVAVAGFSLVLNGLDDPDIEAAAAQSPLADLRTLSNGFRDLAQKALAPPPAVVPAAAIAAAAPIVPPHPPVYTTEDSSVTPPVAIKQAIPPYSRPVTQRKTAIVQLVIDEKGSVESASMLTPLDPQYDRTVLAAARNWQYQPAKADGKPVKYQKRVQITLVPGN
jgi:TonB family protein